MTAVVGRSLVPASRTAGIVPYRAAANSLAVARPTDLLDLSANEGRSLEIGPIFEDIAGTPGILSRYPDASKLEQVIARRLGIGPERIIATAGADDALYRLALSMLEPGRTAITTEPTFEMIPRYIALAGGAPCFIPWLTGSFPLERLTRGISPSTSALFIVSPNNPTGAVISSAELRAIRAAAPDPLLILDLAYTEFADEDLTAVALSLPHTVITRTFSKAWGLAGLRVGYAAGDPQVIDWLRGTGNPYAVSSLSLAVVERALDTLEPEMCATVARIRGHRETLARYLATRGIEYFPSQANFILVRFPSLARARTVFDGLRRRNILVRTFPNGRRTLKAHRRAPEQEPASDVADPA